MWKCTGGLKSLCWIDVCSNYLQQSLFSILGRETQSGLQFRNKSSAIILSDFLSDSICALQLNVSVINKSPEENAGKGQTTEFSSVNDDVREEQWCLGMSKTHKGGHKGEVLHQ